MAVRSSLDEVGELPAETQIGSSFVFWQEHEFESVGGSPPNPRRDVKVIAATIVTCSRHQRWVLRLIFFIAYVFPDRELSSTRQKTFLCWSILIRSLCAKSWQELKRVTKNMLELLHSILGLATSVLQNVIERSVILGRNRICPDRQGWLPLPLRRQNRNATLSSSKTSRRTRRTEAEALKESPAGYSDPGAAAKLGIPRSTLNRKIRSRKSIERYKSERPRSLRHVAPPAHPLDWSNAAAPTASPFGTPRTNGFVPTKHKSRPRVNGTWVKIHRELVVNSASRARVGLKEPRRSPTENL